MRIGTNHGSLSDRIMSRYGDTPLGMVESALEFLRICEDLNYYDTVLSMKSSNPQVMVQAYRLLVQKLDEEGFQPYPLHLGVTEAGEGEDGRIKSAMGIGTLLEDGLGDTVRVSLTEEPEFEAPVAKIMVDRYDNRNPHKTIPELAEAPVDPFSYTRRKTHEVLNFGNHNVPRVVTDFSRSVPSQYKDLKEIGHFYLPELDKWKMNDLGTDYLYSGEKPVGFMLPNGLKEILDYPAWLQSSDKHNRFPYFKGEEILTAETLHPEANFLGIDIDHFSGLIPFLKEDHRIILVLSTGNAHAMAELRRVFFYLVKEELTHPVVLRGNYEGLDTETMQIHASTDLGGLLVDGFGDGILLDNKEGDLGRAGALNSAAFGILQAARTRMTKTEYISCPSCGRTLFDLQETTAMIRKRTDHLKGVKIGIMGCIVNGPGEMADADYGYVGSGKGKITLYRGKEVVKRSVPSEYAVDELISIIKEDNNWIEPDGVE